MRGKTGCRHCGGGPVNRPRGLCWTCYHKPGVRELYPSASKYAPTGEPTREELDAMITEQLRPENLPPWWPKTPDQQRDELERGD